MLDRNCLNCYFSERHPISDGFFIGAPISKPEGYRTAKVTLGFNRLLSRGRACSGTSGPAFRIVQGEVDRSILRIQACLEEGIAAGEIAPYADASSLAKLFWYAWEGAVLGAKLEKSRSPLDAGRRIHRTVARPRATGRALNRAECATAFSRWSRDVQELTWAGNAAGPSKAEARGHERLAALPASAGVCRSCHQKGIGSLLWEACREDRTICLRAAEIEGSDYCTVLEHLAESSRGDVA
jgi:hypothetical protein